MKKYKPLTIEPMATKGRIKADGRTPAAWTRLRGFAGGTAQRIFAGTYPHTENPDSEYQRVLKALEADGYLVQADGAVESVSAAA